MLNLLRDLLAATAGVTPEIKARFRDEGLCRRCGQCCFGATRVKDRMVLLRDLPCKHLRVESEGRTECRIYPRREQTGFCHRLTVDSIRRELFPPDCPYVRGLPRYRGKVELSPAEFEAVKPILRNIFPLVDRPEYIRKKDWDRFLHHTLGLPRPEESE